MASAEVQAAVAAVSAVANVRAFAAHPAVAEAQIGLAAIPARKKVAILLGTASPRNL